MDVSWIKITTDIFDDEKILLIEQLPEHDSIIVIWFKLLALAGKSNNNGVFMLSNKIPYTAEMFSAIFRRPLNTVKLALETFQNFGMIEIVDNVVTLPNWDKHQNIKTLDDIREQTRLRVQKHRENQKQQIKQLEESSEKTDECNVTCNDSNVTVTDKIREEEDKNKNLNIPNEIWEITEFLYSECQKDDSHFSRTKKQLTNWADDIFKLNRIDGYDIATIYLVMRYAKSDSFWRTNIQSGATFRKQFQKLYPKAKKENGLKNKFTPIVENTHELTDAERREIPF